MRSSPNGANAVAFNVMLNALAIAIAWERTMARFGTVLLSLLVFATAVASEERDTKQVQDDFRPRALGMEVPVLQPGAKRDDYVGRLVAVRGEVSDTKLANINGVRVNANLELRGKEAYAVGILIQRTVSEQDVRTLNERGVAHDGPGTKYALHFDLGGRLAEARPIPRE
jgi:hypothetical protein